MNTSFRDLLRSYFTRLSVLSDPVLVFLALFVGLLRVRVFLFFLFLFTQFLYNVVCSVSGVVGLLSLF